MQEPVVFLSKRKLQSWVKQKLRMDNEECMNCALTETNTVGLRHDRHGVGDASDDLHVVSNVSNVGNYAHQATMHSEEHDRFRLSCKDHQRKAPTIYP